MFQHTGESNKGQKRKTNACDFHLMNIFKPWCQSNSASIPGVIEKVNHAMAELSDALSQVSDAMAKVIAAVLLLPRAFLSSSNDGNIDTAMPNDGKVSNKIVKSQPPSKANTLKTDPIGEAKQNSKVI